MMGSAYPIKITGVGVSLPPKALHRTEMRPIQQTIWCGGPARFGRSSGWFCARLIPPT
jgi:hypothetical protein